MLAIINMERTRRHRDDDMDTAEWEGLLGHGFAAVQTALARDLPGHGGIEQSWTYPRRIQMNVAFSQAVDGPFYIRAERMNFTVNPHTGQRHVDLWELRTPMLLHGPGVITRHSGAGTVFARNLFNTMRLTGFTQLNLIAGVPNGMFFWARRGLRFKDAQAREGSRIDDAVAFNAIRLLRLGHISEAQKAEVDAIMADKADLYANCKITALSAPVQGGPLGLALMQGMKFYHASLNIDDEAAQPFLARTNSRAEARARRFARFENA